MSLHALRQAAFTSPAPEATAIAHRPKSESFADALSRADAARRAAHPAKAVNRKSAAVASGAGKAPLQTVAARASAPSKAAAGKQLPAKAEPVKTEPAKSSAAPLQTAKAAGPAGAKPTLTPGSPKANTAANATADETEEPAAAATVVLPPPISLVSTTASATVPPSTIADQDNQPLDADEEAADPPSGAVTDEPSGQQTSALLDAFSPADPTAKTSIATIAEPAAAESAASVRQTINATPSVAGISQPATSAAQSSATPTAPAPAAETPPSPPSVQIGVSLLRSAVGLEQQVFSLQLRPERLGSVDVRLELDKNGRARASFTAEHADTLQLLQRDVHHLVSALKQAGVDADPSSLSFSLKDSPQEQSGFSQARDGSNRAGAFGNATPSAEPIAAPPTLSNRLYDIHA